MVKSASKSRIELIERTFGLATATDGLLLLLRIVTDTDTQEGNLHQDIHDLYFFPERLQQSYRDEWRSWIKRQLHRCAFIATNASDAQSLNQYLQRQYTERGDEITQRYDEYLQVLRQVSAIQQAGNVRPLKSKLRQTLEMLLRS